jgi:hypothetical protein
MNTTRETALITGASSGMGVEFAHILASRGVDLVLVARRAERLHSLAEALRTEHKVNATVIAQDLSQPHAATALWENVKAGGHRIDILVNNAGVGLAGEFANSDPEAVEAMMELDVVTLTILCRLALPEMLKRGRGRILNVASLVAFQGGGPGMAVYYAAKSFVLSFTRALARELRGSGVTATVLCPGTTRTEFDAASGAGRLRLFRWMPLSDARAVAEAGVEAMYAGRVAIVPGLINKVLAVAGEMPPRRISVEVNRFLLRP